MLKSIVLQQKEERDLLLSKQYQKRFTLEQESDLLNSPLIKLVTGPRRAGKSVFALQLLNEKKFAYLNFDDAGLLKHFNEDQALQTLLEVYPGFQFLLLDEIQNLPKWDMWVGKLYRRGINITITGSNSNLLSNEMATLLTGRFVQVKIFPFSFSETVQYNRVCINNNTPTERAELLTQLNEYMLMGGFPEIVKNATSPQIISVHFSTPYC